MTRTFSLAVVGWLFVGAAAMLWLGWMIMPVHIGTFFQPGDFAAVYDQLHFWIWTYRIYLFGFLTALMALAALSTQLGEAEARVLVVPGAAVAAAGLIVAALAAAFYYHFGAWGAIDMAGKSETAVREFVDSLKNDTEYVTCLVRFGRVFLGLGQLVLAVGLLRGRILPRWLAGAAALLGVAAMAITMAFPDDLEYYRPVFHLNAAWLLAAGIVVLRSGLGRG